MNDEVKLNFISIYMFIIIEDNRLNTASSYYPQYLQYSKRFIFQKKHLHKIELLALIPKSTQI